MRFPVYIRFCHPSSLRRPSVVIPSSLGSHPSTLFRVPTDRNDNFSHETRCFIRTCVISLPARPPADLYARARIYRTYPWYPPPPTFTHHPRVHRVLASPASPASRPSQSLTTTPAPTEKPLAGCPACLSFRTTRTIKSLRPTALPPTTFPPTSVYRGVFHPPPSPSSPSRRYVASPKNKNITVFPSFPAIILNVIITIFSLRFRYRPCDDDDVGNVAFCVRTTTAATGSFRVIFYWCVLRYRIYVCKHIHTKRAVWIKKR